MKHNAVTMMMKMFMAISFYRCSQAQVKAHIRAKHARPNRSIPIHMADSFQENHQAGTPHSATRVSQPHPASNCSQGPGPTCQDFIKIEVPAGRDARDRVARPVGQVDRQGQRRPCRTLPAIAGPTDPATRRLGSAIAGGAPPVVRHHPSPGSLVADASAN